MQMSITLPCKDCGGKVKIPVTEINSGSEHACRDCGAITLIGNENLEVVRRLRQVIDDIRGLSSTH